MDEPRKGFERRMVHRLLRHWRDAQVEGGIPSLDAVYKQGLGDIVPQSPSGKFMSKRSIV